MTGSRLTLRGRLVRVHGRECVLVDHLRRDAAHGFTAI